MLETIRSDADEEEDSSELSRRNGPQRKILIENQSEIPIAPQEVLHDEIVRESPLSSVPPSAAEEGRLQAIPVNLGGNNDSIFPLKKLERLLDIPNSKN